MNRFSRSRCSPVARRLPRRRGTVLVAALICLLVVTALVGALLKGALLARRHLHQERNLRQTELLLQAGVDRAQARLTADRGYQGETWAPPEGALPMAAQITIRPLPVQDDQNQQFEVSAEYPLGSEYSVRRSRLLSSTFHSNPPEE